MCVAGKPSMRAHPPIWKYGRCCHTSPRFNFWVTQIYVTWTTHPRKPLQTQSHPSAPTHAKHYPFTPHTTIHTHLHPSPSSVTHLMSLLHTGQRCKLPRTADFESHKFTSHVPHPCKPLHTQTHPLTPTQTQSHPSPPTYTNTNPKSPIHTHLYP